MKEPRAPRQTSKWLAFWRPRPGLAVGDGVVGPSWRQLEVLQAGHMKETTEGGGEIRKPPSLSGILSWPFCSAEAGTAAGVTLWRSDVASKRTYQGTRQTGAEGEGRKKTNYIIR